MNIYEKRINSLINDWLDNSSLATFNYEQTEEFILNSINNQENIIDNLIRSKHQTQFENEIEEYVRTIVKEALEEINLSPTDIDVIDEVVSYLGYMNKFMFVILIWMKLENASDIVENSAYKLYRYGVLNVLGFRLQDLYIDEQKGKGYNVLIGLKILFDNENNLLEIFGFNETNLQAIRVIRNKYLSAEIREKIYQDKGVSPYQISNPALAGEKGLLFFPPIALMVLLSKEKEEDIPKYERFFCLMSAAQQMIDDLSDIEDDTRNGHFSYPTLLLSKEDLLPPYTDIKNKVHANEILKELHHSCIQMLDEARTIAIELNSGGTLFIGEISRMLVNQGFFKIIQ